MKRIIIILIIAVLTATCMLHSSCRSADIDLKSVNKPILQKDMMKGYKIYFSELYDEENGDEYIHYSEIWKRELFEGYDRRYHSMIYIDIKVFKNRSNALDYIGRHEVRWPKSSLKKGFGEKYCVLFTKSIPEVCIKPIKLMFLKNNTIVTVSGRGPYGDPPSDSPDFFWKVARYIESKI